MLTDLLNLDYGLYVVTKSSVELKKTAHCWQDLILKCQKAPLTIVSQTQYFLPFLSLKKQLFLGTSVEKSALTELQTAMNRLELKESLLTKLPEQLSTIEWQKFALIRGVLQKKPLVIWDILDGLPANQTQQILRFLLTASKSQMIILKTSDQRILALPEIKEINSL